MFCKKIVCSVTRKDKKAIATQSVKGAKGRVENLSIEYFIMKFGARPCKFQALNRTG